MKQESIVLLSDAFIFLSMFILHKVFMNVEQSSEIQAPNCWKSGQRQVMTLEVVLLCILLKTSS